MWFGNFFSRVKAGIPVSVKHLPDPTRIRGHGSGRVYPQTSNLYSRIYDWQSVAASRVVTSREHILPCWRQEYSCLTLVMLAPHRCLLGNYQVFSTTVMLYKSYTSDVKRTLSIRSHGFNSELHSNFTDSPTREQAASGEMPTHLLQCSWHHCQVH